MPHHAENTTNMHCSAAAPVERLNMLPAPGAVVCNLIEFAKLRLCISNNLLASLLNGSIVCHVLSLILQAGKVKKLF